VLKALKPDESWSRHLTFDEQAVAPASWSQIQRTLVTIDPEWAAFFTSIYPESFGTVAETQDLDAAIAQQTEANRLLKDILGPAQCDASDHVQRLTKCVEFINKQLTAGQTFMHEVSG
jgi:hypothetical protein